MKPKRELVFLKLGGSLITDKMQPHTPRREVIARLAHEIASACKESPASGLILGHGSGSFGHVPAKKYGTRQGVHSEEEWRGFSEVWYEASSLNRLVIEALRQTGLPAVSFPPSSAAVAQDGQIIAWNTAPIEGALEHGLLPVIYGDVAFDTSLGGTILSTEDLFTYLARKLQPARLLLAGLEEGVWEDYPVCTRLLTKITPQNYPKLRLALGGSAGADVTGGMESKVRQVLALLQENPDLQAWIFSGAEAGNVRRALLGASAGTHLSS